MTSSYSLTRVKSQKIVKNLYKNCIYYMHLSRLLFYLLLLISTIYWYRYYLLVLICTDLCSIPDDFFIKFIGVIFCLLTFTYII